VALLFVRTSSTHDMSPTRTRNSIEKKNDETHVARDGICDGNDRAVSVPCSSVVGLPRQSGATVRGVQRTECRSSLT
jgi:hypothetical protein